MRWFAGSLVSIVGLLVVALTLLGTSPNQAERPPQPFFQDFFSGSVLLQGSPAPGGSLLIACIDACESGFESVPYRLKADGSFDQLEVNPESEDFIGHLITFYLINEFGRIRALETRPYIGVFDFYVQDLTFVDPMPVPPVPPPEPTATPIPTPSPTPKPTPTASLPVAGDPAVARLPKLVLVAGALVAVLGGSLMVLTRREHSQRP